MRTGSYIAIVIAMSIGGPNADALPKNLPQPWKPRVDEHTPSYYQLLLATKRHRRLMLLGLIHGLQCGSSPATMTLVAISVHH